MSSVLAAYDLVLEIVDTPLSLKDALCGLSAAR